MKKILIFAAVLMSLGAAAQKKTVQSQYGFEYVNRVSFIGSVKLPTDSSKSTKDLNDPAHDTAQVYYNKPDSTIRIWTGYQWLAVGGSGGSGGFFDPDQTATSHTVHNGNNFDFTVDSSSNVTFNLKKDGGSQFDIYASQGFFAQIGDISNSYYGYYDLWPTFNEFYLGVDGGETMISQVPSSSGSETLIWSKLSGNGSFLSIQDDQIYLQPRNGDLKIFGLTNLSTQNRLLGQFGTSSQLGYITTGYGVDIVSGVFKVDTSLISTKPFRDKLKDSLGVVIGTKLNISDTANKWVNTITRTPGKDSIIFYVGATRYAIKDSTGGGGGYTTLSQFVGETNWQMYYSNGSGDVTGTTVGAANTVLTGNGATSAPTWEPVVAYNFTGLANWDKLRYNSSSSEFVNFSSTRTYPENPAIKMLAKDTVTNQEYYTDIPTGGSSSAIQELDTLTDLDDADGNAAIIDGRLWIKYTSVGSWRRQAYDTTYTPAADPLILDEEPGAEVAFSLRKLSNSYSGDCVRVRRSSDDAEQDFGFVDDYLDTASVKTFVGANNGTIVTWFDGTGNGNDAQQPTHADQPFLIISGSIQYVNGKPALYVGDASTFSGYMTLPTGLLNGATELSYFHVAKIQDFTNSNAGVFGPSNTNSVGLQITQLNVIAKRTRLSINGTARNDNAAAGYQLWVDNAQSLTTILGNASSVAAYNDGAAVTLTDASAMPALNFNGVYGIGIYNGTSNTMRGYLQEIIIYTTDKTASRTGIEGNMNTFYTVY